MLKEKLIQQHIKLGEKTPEGWSKGILGITKETIKNILEYAYKDIGNTDILTKKEIDKINHELIHIGNISMVDFFQYNANVKLKIIISITETLGNFSTDKADHIITMGRDIIKDLENNITDEHGIINFLKKTREYLEEYSSTRIENKKRLLGMTTKEKVLQTIGNTDKELLTDVDNLKNIIKSDQTSESYITIVKNSLHFLGDLEKDIDKSYSIFIKALQSNNFRYAKIILQKRKSSLQEQGLMSRYNNVMNNILYLESNHAVDSELIKESIVRSMNDLYDLKNDYLTKNIDNIALVNLHNSVWDSFHDALKSVKDLIAYSQITDFHTSNNDLIRYLLKNKEINSITYQAIIKNDYKISLEEIDAFAKESLEKILKRSNIAKARDDIEDLRMKKKEEAEKNKENKPTLGEKVINKLQDGLVYGRRKLLQFSKTLKGLPKLIVMGVILIVVVLTKILQGIKSLIEGLFKKVSGGDFDMKHREGGSKTQENNDNNGNDSDNKLLEVLINAMRSQGIKDLLNSMFNGDLMSMSNKENDLRNERDLMNRGIDKLSRVNIINYHKLDNTLLVGEVFFRLVGTKRQKENINHNNQHVLETNQDGLYSQDYSFFLDKHKRELHYEEEHDYPTLVLDNGSLTKGFNSIVCPRGYLPMLSIHAKQSLQEQGITYKLYCIKNLGYYYLRLDKTPKGVVDIHYVRYGDREYNGVFFNTLENQGSEGYQNIDSLLTEKILDISDVPENIQNVVNEQSKMRDTKTLCEYSTNFLSDNFLYSKESWNTTQHYLQHKSYMSGIAHVGVGDCKNINSLNIGLLREQNIQAQECAGYVRGSENDYEGHGVTEVNIEDKCLLLDATPSKEAEGRKDKKEKKEKKENENLSLVKTFIAEIAENINNKYKKRITGLKSKEKIDTELLIQKNISWGEGGLKNILNNYNRNIYGDDEKIYSELLLGHINNLTIKKHLALFPTYEKNQLLIKYYERLKNLYIFCEYSRGAQDKDLMEYKRNIISELAQLNENTYQIMSVLQSISGQRGVEISIDSVNQKIIEKRLLKDIISLSNTELAQEIASEFVISDFKNDSNLSLLTDAIEIYVSKVFDTQFLPYDIEKYIDMNDGRFSQQKELFNQNEKDLHEKNKQDIVPGKVKNIVTKEFLKVKESLEEEIYKRHNSNTRMILLSMLDRVYGEFNHIDDVIRVGWNKEKLNEFVEGFKNRKTFQAGKRIKDFPNQDIASKLYLLVAVCNGYDRLEDTEDKVIGEDFKNEYLLVCNMLGKSTRYNDDKYYDYRDLTSLEFLQKSLKTNNSIFMVGLINYLKNKWKENPHRYIFIGDKRIDGSQMNNEVFPFLEEKVLLDYQENPCTILNLLVSKESLKTKDISTIKSSFQEIIGRKLQGSQETLVIEKSIFNVIEMIIKSKESYSSHYNYGGIRNPYLLGSEYNGFFEEKSELILLQELISFINSDQVIDIIQKAYNIFYIEEKKYRKGKTDDSSSGRILERNEILNMRKIIKILIRSFKTYTLHNKKSVTLTLLEFKLNQLYGRIREM